MKRIFCTIIIFSVFFISCESHETHHNITVHEREVDADSSDVKIQSGTAEVATPSSGNELYVLLDAPESVSVGDEVDFTIHYGNRGKQEIDEVVITQQIDNSAFRITGAEDGEVIADDTIEFAVGTLQPEEHGSCRFSVKVKKATGGQIQSKTNITGRAKSSPKLIIED